MQEGGLEDLAKTYFFIYSNLNLIQIIYVGLFRPLLSHSTY